MTSSIKAIQVFAFALTFISGLCSCTGSNIALSELNAPAQASQDPEDPLADESSNSECTKGITLDDSRGSCTEDLSVESRVSISAGGGSLVIQSNNIPGHRVGKFGAGTGSLNPNAISAQNSTYRIDEEPVMGSGPTWLLGSNGPEYSFGILLNGVEVDPVAAEPWPHDRRDMTNVNWEWNLEATNIAIGLDCNNAHVQPTGKYHYHASPTLLLESLDIDPLTMTMIGYAADGFPIYYKYGFDQAGDGSSGVKVVTPSYRLKSGQRPGDGVSAPCGPYNGIYSNDYEYSEGLGDLDACNGRFGVTPEYPWGIYYYVITEAFPAIPRCFSGLPSADFKIGF